MARGNFWTRTAERRNKRWAMLLAMLGIAAGSVYERHLIVRAGRALLPAVIPFGGKRWLALSLAQLAARTMKRRRRRPSRSRPKPPLSRGA